MTEDAVGRRRRKSSDILGGTALVVEVAGWIVLFVGPADFAWALIAAGVILYLVAAVTARRDA